MQRVEIGDAVDAEHDGLAIDNELLLAVLQRGFDNPGEALGPIVAVARQEAHGLAVALDAQAIAVIFDFSWIQSGPVGTTLAAVGKQNSNAVDMNLR